jgi:hypothetical protein
MKNIVDTSKFLFGILYFFDESMIIIVYYRSSIKRANLYGLFFSLTNSVMYFSLAALFRLGAYLVQQNSITFQDVLL